MLRLPDRWKLVIRWESNLGCDLPGLNAPNDHVLDPSRLPSMVSDGNQSSSSFDSGFENFAGKRIKEIKIFSQKGGDAPACKGKLCAPPFLFIW